MKSQHSSGKRPPQAAPPRRAWQISLDMIESTPGEMEDNIKRLLDSLRDLQSEHRDMVIPWIVDKIEAEAIAILEQHGLPTDPGELRPLDENQMRPLPANARAAILQAHAFRSSMDDDDIHKAALDMMLLTLATVRYLAGLGMAQHEGSKKGRWDPLQLLAQRTFITLCRKNGEPPTTKDVISQLKEHDTAGFAETIQEINCDKECIFWIDRRGREKKTHFKTFANRLTKMRKRAGRPVTARSH